MKTPNALGLYDMSGNILEWAADYEDVYSDDSEIDPIGSAVNTHSLHGGCYGYGSGNLRTAFRMADMPSMNIIGFRVCRNAE